MEEIWKDIRGFEGIYQVSNMGRVRSLDRWSNDERHRRLKGKILKPNKDRYGYLKIGLLNKVRITYQVHRLVALHFVSGYKEGLIVNHKDEDRSNNQADNLEWCTQQYNLRYSDSIAWVRRKLYQYDLDGNLIKTYSCANQAEKELGFTLRNALYVKKCNGITHGFLFKLEPRKNK